MERVRRTLRRERGASALEYILVLALVGLVVVALVGSGLKTRSTSAVQTAVCNLFSAGCGDDVAGGPAGAGPQPGDGGLIPGDELPPDGGGGGGGGGDDGGGFWDGVRRGGGAFFDGLIRGDLNRDDRTDNGWIETSRGVGQFISGVLVVGDVRDAGAAVGELWSSGGRDGWGNLIISGVGVIPIAGDAVKGIRGGSRVVDAVRAGDDVPRPRDPNGPGGNGGDPPGGGGRPPDEPDIPPSSRLVPGGGLRGHEGPGRGHTLSRHVDVDDQALRDRLVNQPNIPAASRYADRTVAEDAISKAIDARQPDIDAWVAGGHPGGTFAYSVPYPNAGVSLARGAADPVTVNSVRVVLRPDPNSPLGYFILTSYPVPP